MQDFKKEMVIGKAKDDKHFTIYVEIDYEGKRLSITGHESDALGRCRCAGQINLDANNIELAPGWNKEKVERLQKIWKEWHLNDMHAECEHQRRNWDTSKQLEIFEFEWSKTFDEMRNRAKNGLMNEKEYSEYRQIVPMVFEATVNTKKHKWLSPLACGLLYRKLIQIRKKTTAPAIWTRTEEHPEGLLCKPCEICGYKYGTKWLHEDVPENILKSLMEM